MPFTPFVFQSDNVNIILSLCQTVPASGCLLWMLHSSFTSQQGMICQVLFRQFEGIQIITSLDVDDWSSEAALSAVLHCLQWYDNGIFAARQSVCLYVPSLIVRRVQEQVHLMGLSIDRAKRLTVRVSEPVPILDTYVDLHIYSECLPHSGLGDVDMSLKTIVLSRLNPDLRQHLPSVPELSTSQSTVYLATIPSTPEDYTNQVDFI